MKDWVLSFWLVSSIAACTPVESRLASALSDAAVVDIRELSELDLCGGLRAGTKGFPESVARVDWDGFVEFLKKLPAGKEVAFVGGHNIACPRTTPVLKTRQEERERARGMARVALKNGIKAVLVNGELPLQTGSR